MLDQTDNQLIESKNLIEIKFEQFLQQPNRYIWKDGLISISLKDKTEDNSTIISDTLINISENNIASAYRKIEFQHKHNNQLYRIKILKELSFTDNLTLNIILLVGGLAIFFTMSFFIVFRIVANTSLLDFYETIKALKEFKIAEPENIKINHSDVDEFEYLNEVITLITSKIQQDYKSLKEFTENASHEIQTPLAIIQNKVEQLIQGEEISEEQMKSFSEILDATSRLSKLNRGLNQLVKIEGGQYIHTEKIDIQNIICKNIDHLGDMLLAKDITVIKNFHSHNKVSINPNLAELLIFNLLKNALMHNVKGGKIIISITDNEITITNSGKDEALNINLLSERFSKGDESKSLGLGLSIVQKICRYSNIDLSYHYLHHMHTIKLVFK